MAKIKVKGISSVQTALKKFIKTELRKKELRQGVGEIVVKSIRAKSFGTAAIATKKWRNIYYSRNETHPDYRLTNINITFTGELLNDLVTNVKAKTVGGFSYVIGHSDKLHKKYNGVSGKIGSRSKYSDISKGIYDHGYKYLDIDDKTLTKVVSYINKEITKSFKNFGK